MIFTALIAAYNSQQKIKNVQRWVVGTKVVFGKSITLPVVNFTLTAPKPAGNKILIYNSHLELTAGRSVTGKKEYFDTVKNPIISNIILEPTVLQTIMEYDGNPYVYLQSHSFNASFMLNGTRKYFRYNPREMYMLMDYTSDFKVFQQMQAAAAVEKSCLEFVAKAQRNARELAAISKLNLNSKQKAQFGLALTQHLFTINEFKRKLPPSFFVETKSIAANKISGVGFLPAIPVIVWVVGLISAAAIVVGIKYLDYKKEVDMQKNRLDSNYNVLQTIKAAAQDLQSGKISQEAYNTIKNQGSGIIDQNNEDNSKQADANAADTASGGFLGKVQDIFLIGLAAVVVSKLVPSNSKQ
ncbi:MAG: hypothetical protein ACOYKE_02435 [Ferruginibacter sp.]